MRSNASLLPVLKGWKMGGVERNQSAIRSSISMPPFFSFFFSFSNSLHRFSRFLWTNIDERSNWIIFKKNWESYFSIERDRRGDNFERHCIKHCVQCKYNNKKKNVDGGAIESRLSSNDFTPRSSTLEKRSGFKIVLPEIALHRLPPFAFRHPFPPSGAAVRESAALVRAFFPATAWTGSEKREERSEGRAGEESSFVTENLLRLSIIFNRENKSFDSIIRGISSVPPSRTTDECLQREKKKKGKGEEGKKPSLCPA